VYGKFFCLYLFKYIACTRSAYLGEAIKCAELARAGGDHHSTKQSVGRGAGYPYRDRYQGDWCRITCSGFRACYLEEGGRKSFTSTTACSGCFPRLGSQYKGGKIGLWGEVVIMGIFCSNFVPGIVSPGHFFKPICGLCSYIEWIYNRSMITTWIIVGVVVVVVLWLVLAYNGLVTVRNRTQEAYSDIDVQLKRRYDLIPNLVEAVKGYASHEKTVFEDVTAARSNAMQATGPARAGAENQLSGALKSLFAVAENYPDLKANQNFLNLQNELTDTEDKIQAARRFYNGMVRDLNTKIQVFPTNMFANMFGFTKMDFFGNDLTDAEKQPVQVKF
jgi:LemA protein